MGSAYTYSFGMSGSILVTAAQVTLISHRPHWLQRLHRLAEFILGRCNGQRSYYIKWPIHFASASGTHTSGVLLSRIIHGSRIQSIFRAEPVGSQINLFRNTRPWRAQASNRGHGGDGSADRLARFPQRLTMGTARVGWVLYQADMAPRREPESGKNGRCTHQMAAQVGECFSVSYAVFR